MQIAYVRESQKIMSMESPRLSVKSSNHDRSQGSVYKFDLNQQLDKGRQVISVQNQKKSIFNNSMQIDQIEVQDEEDDNEDEDDDEDD